MWTLGISSAKPSWREEMKGVYLIIRVMFSSVGVGRSRRTMTININVNLPQNSLKKIHIILLKEKLWNGIQRAVHSRHLKNMAVWEKWKNCKNFTLLFLQNDETGQLNYVALDFPSRRSKRWKNKVELQEESLYAFTRDWIVLMCDKICQFKSALFI